MEGDPTIVDVNMYVRSMGQIDEAKSIFSLDIYFRQYWTDKRLLFNSTNVGTRLLDSFHVLAQVEELVLNWQFLSWIWRPDTYFVNGQESYLHKVAVPNRFIRISPLGRVSYSQRLTVTARCKMNLRKFPHDSQSCPLKVSFNLQSFTRKLRFKTTLVGLQLWSQCR